MPPVARPLVAACLAALTLSACGAADEDSSTDFNGEERLVANVVEDLSDAGADRDADAICGLLSEDLIKQIRTTAGGKATCAEAVDDAVEDADAFAIDVKSVKVDGTGATAVVESKENDDEIRDTLTLVKESGRWKISALRG